MIGPRISPRRLGTRRRPPSSAPATPPRSREQRGFTLVEIAIALSLAGMILAVAIPTFIQKLETSKAAEATRHLEHLFQHSAAYYAAPRNAANDQLAHCLPADAGPTPATPSAQPVAVDFGAEGVIGLPTWHALGFAPAEPLRYRYTFLVEGPRCVSEVLVPAPLLILRAEGDLDGDGTYSRYERRAKLLAHGKLEPERMLRVYDRIE